MVVTLGIMRGLTGTREGAWGLGREVRDKDLLCRNRGRGDDIEFSRRRRRIRGGCRRRDRLLSKFVCVGECCLTMR